MLRIRRYGDDPARMQETTDTTRRMSVSSEEKRNDKRLRQRSKFLSVFLGPKKKSTSTDTVKGQTKVEQPKPTKAAKSHPPEASRIAKWQPLIPASTLRRSDTMVTATATLPHASARRRSPPERGTDTSGSEEMGRRHQRFNQLRQKSQVIHLKKITWDVT